MFNINHHWHNSLSLFHLIETVSQSLQTLSHVVEADLTTELHFTVCSQHDCG